MSAHVSLHQPLSWTFFSLFLSLCHTHSLFRCETTNFQFPIFIVQSKAKWLSAHFSPLIRIQMTSEKKKLCFVWKRSTIWVTDPARFSFFSFRFVYWQKITRRLASAVETRMAANGNGILSYRQSCSAFRCEIMLEQPELMRWYSQHCVTQRMTATVRSHRRLRSERASSTEQSSGRNVLSKWFCSNEILRETGGGN